MYDIPSWIRFKMFIRVYKTRTNESGENETTTKTVSARDYANNDNERPAPLYTNARGSNLNLYTGNTIDTTKSRRDELVT